MKVMYEAPTLRSRRLLVTEHGIPSQARASRGQSHRSSRRSHDLPGGLGKPVVGRRVTGELLEPDAATRNAERPKGEKRQLASRLPGNSYGRFARCADGKGPRERPLVSRLSYFGHPFTKLVVCVSMISRFYYIPW
jgi:hypothetical protein